MITRHLHSGFGLLQQISIHKILRKAMDPSEIECVNFTSILVTLLDQVIHVHYFELEKCGLSKTDHLKGKFLDVVRHSDLSNT